MPIRFQNSQRLRKPTVGFSLVELLIAMAVTIIVMVGAVMMFLKSNDTNNMTLQMSEMQANARTAANLMSQDISQAGEQITGGVGLPGGPGTVAENFGVNPAYLTPQTFYSTTTAPITTYMYGITPAFAAGPTIGTQAMDGINIVYRDPILSDATKSNWTLAPVTLTAAGATITVNAAGLNPTVLDPNTGLRVGDVLMFFAGQRTAIGVVSTAPIGTTFTIAPGDAFNINQAAATFNNMLSLQNPGPPPAFPATGITMMRLNVVTYFLQAVQADGFTPIPLPAAGAADYRLMRQLNGQPPAAVAEHIDYLHFYYDLADPAAPPSTNLSHLPDAIEPAIPPNPATPAYSLIRTVYINVAARTAKPDGHGQYAHATINTAIGPQALSFRNIYPPPTGP
jgi:type II secretory pathway pseudopilin PulG